MTIPSINGGSPSMTTLASTLDRLNNQYTSLEAATASGIVSDTYAGLGSARYEALSLQPEITKISGWQGNVTAAQTTLSVTQSALTSISSIASSLQTTLTSLESDSSTTTIAAAASQAKEDLSSLASLANTQSGSSYVFGGTEPNVAPITDPTNILTSSTVTAIAASVAQVGTEGAASVVSQTLDDASDNTAGQSIFNTSLSVDPDTAATQTRSTIVGANDKVSVGYVLTQGSTATTTSTGSPIRDLIRALSIVAGLPAADSSSSGYSTLISDTAQSVQATSTALTEVSSQLGQTQDSLTTQSDSLSTLSDALTTQLSTAKDTDPTTLSAELSQIKDQLTASYSLISDMKGMSLAAYL